MDIIRYIELSNKVNTLENELRDITNQLRKTRQAIKQFILDNSHEAMILSPDGAEVDVSGETTEPMLTTEEVCSMLNVVPRTLYNMVYRQEIIPNSRDGEKRNSRLSFPFSEVKRVLTLRTPKKGKR